MATYKIRGTAHNVIYPYKVEDGTFKQQWETYTTELEAMQRKAYIDYLQKTKNAAELMKTVLEYKAKRSAEKASLPTSTEVDVPMPLIPASDDNTHKTYRDFNEKWLPFHARKKRLSPNTYDSYRGNLNNHILPYFGDRVMSTITSEDVDNFLDFLSEKPCRGTKSYGKAPQDIPTLSSSVVKKCYNIIIAGFSTAKKWRYITDIPETTAPVEKYKKRKAWEPKQVLKTLNEIREDRLLHLAVHLAFVCSLRAGETVGIHAGTIDFYDRSLWITQEVQRVSDESLEVLPKNEIIRVFPKKIASSQSSLILKSPKTEGSNRKQYLTTPILQEIKGRIAEIEANKKAFGRNYHDHGLLLCHPDGQPIDPKTLDKSFKSWQMQLGIASDEQIEFQGLRKSGQMHKVRLSNNNYQLVAENSGQSPEVLMSNYNEALDSEKRTLSMLVETSFYASGDDAPGVVQPAQELQGVLRAIQENPQLSQQLMQLLLSGALSAT